MARQQKVILSLAEVTQLQYLMCKHEMEHVELHQEYRAIAYETTLHKHEYGRKGWETDSEITARLSIDDGKA